MKNDKNLYQSFLLRLWRDAADQPFCFLLQDTRTQRQLLFSDLEALARYLTRLERTLSQSPPEDS